MKAKVKMKTWDQLIDEGERRGAVSEEAVKRAADWTTCALGEALSTRTAWYRAKGLPTSKRRQRRQVAARRAFRFADALRLSCSANEANLYTLGCRFATDVRSCSERYGYVPGANEFAQARKTLAKLREVYAAITARKEKVNG